MCPIASDNLSPEITIKQYQDNEEVNDKWWNVDEKEMYSSVFSVCDEILTNLNIRRRMNYFFASLYNDIGAAFTSSQNINLYYNRSALDGAALTNTRMTLNVLQNVIDTATSLIAKNKPKPQFITDGALSYNTKVRGERLTKYVEGVFTDTNLYTLAQRVFQDACVYGTGAIKLYSCDDGVEAEWVFIEEILVDDLEGMHQDPQQLHQRRYIQRDILLETYPKFADKINAASQSANASTLSTADLIPVIESWHLPSGKKAKDGRHSICIDTATLFSEKYNKDYFPILFFRWADQTLGFWGRGICHEIWKVQIELDTLLRLTQQSMRLVGGPTIAVESGSNIQEDHITSNKIAKIVEYTQTPPQYMTPPTIQPEIFNHIQFLKSSMYEIPGVSESSATGNKPKEVKSGSAIREATDIAAGRFEIVGQRWEQFFISMAKIIVDISSDIVKSGKSLSIMTKDSKGANRIDFKEALVDIDDYQIELFPVSGLPSTPAGKLDQLMDYADAGYVSKTQVMDIVQFPDLKDTVSLETAALHLTQEILSNIKEKGEYTPPGPFLDLPNALRMASLEVCRAKLQHVDEANIELLRRFVNEVQEEIDKLKSQQQAQAPQQPQPQPMQAPPAQPMEPQG